jgi:hypothetical protein
MPKFCWTVAIYHYCAMHVPLLSHFPLPSITFVDAIIECFSQSAIMAILLAHPSYITFRNVTVVTVFGLCHVPLLSHVKTRIYNERKTN